MRKNQRRRGEHRLRLFGILLVVLISITIVAQAKDKLFPFIKNTISNEPSSDHVLADSDIIEEEDSDSSEDKEDIIDIEEDHDEEQAIKEELLENTVYLNDEGKKIINNPNDILVLVNKERNLSSDYKPDDLVVPNVRFSFEGNDQKKYLRKEAAKALEDLFKEGEKEDIALYAVSGYRSYSRQELLFNNKANKVGAEAANKLVARPGQSEHHTGLAMDVSSKSANFSLAERFGETAEGIWLKENAHKFGFIIRYPKEKTDITGYSYEPWHIRYVGKEIAEEIYEKDITLEEYFGFEYSENSNSLHNE